MIKINKTFEEFEEKFVSVLFPSGIKAVQYDYEPIKNFFNKALLTAYQQGKKDREEEILEYFEKNYEFPDGEMNGAWIYLGDLEEFINNK